MAVSLPDVNAGWGEKKKKTHPCRISEKLESINSRRLFCVENCTDTGNAFHKC